MIQEGSFPGFRFDEFMIGNDPANEVCPLTYSIDNLAFKASNTDQDGVVTFEVLDQY